MNKFFVLILLLVVNSKNLVHAQSSIDPEICSTQDGSSCVNLNNLLVPCGGKLGPPPSNISSLEYDVDSKKYFFFYYPFFVIWI
jgi:hypothetical protein